MPSKPRHVATVGVVTLVEWRPAGQRTGQLFLPISDDVMALMDWRPSDALALTVDVERREIRVRLAATTAPQPST